MDSGKRQQAGNRSVVLIYPAVGKNEQCIAGLDGQRCPAGKFIQRRSKSCFAILCTEQRRQGNRQQVSARNPAQLFQIAIGENRMRQLQSVAILWSLIQDVALGTDIADERHDHLFADWINWWICHLCKKLLEIIEERLRLVAQAGQRRIRPHRADRFLAFGRHWLDDHFQVFIGIAKRALAREDSRVIRCMHAHRLGQLVERNLIFFQPLAVRLACR